MQHIFIINPTAGKVDASVALIPQIHAAASRAGLHPTIEVTRRAGQARDLAAQYAAGGEEVYLYACGGDGTLNEILQGTVGHPNAAIGCVPCGSGNDYVRNFGTQAQFLDLDAQLAAQPFAADVIRTPQGCGIDIYAAGIDAQVANGIPKWRRVPFCGGTTAYTLSILEAVCSTFRHRLRITADDLQLEDTFMMLAVCNGQQYGGGYCAAPHASMTDGLLDVVLLRPVPRLKLPGLLGSYKKGEHLSEGDTVTEKFAPYMTFFRTGSIDIEVLDGNPLITTLDGECSPQLRMHAEIAHSAARILNAGRRVLAPAADARGDRAQCGAHSAAAGACRKRKQDACSAGYGRVRMSEKVKIKIARNVVHLPAIALRGLVVFPNNVVHFEVGRTKSIAAIEAAMHANSSVFLVAQREMDEEEPALHDLYSYGVIAEIKQVLRVSDDLVKAPRGGARHPCRQAQPGRGSRPQPEGLL